MLGVLGQGWGVKPAEGIGWEWDRIPQLSGMLLAAEMRAGEARRNETRVVDFFA